jgi:hypothetical protein
VQLNSPAHSYSSESTDCRTLSNCAANLRIS